MERERLEVVDIATPVSHTNAGNPCFFLSICDGPLYFPAKNKKKLPVYLANPLTGIKQLR